jgi:hypothetical protein
LYFDGTPG